MALLDRLLNFKNVALRDNLRFLSFRTHSLQFMRFANRFRPSLENVSLWSLELLGLFTQSLENVAFPDYLQFLRFDSVCNQGLKNVALRDHLWNLESVWPYVAGLSLYDLFTQRLENAARLTACSP